MDIYIFCGKGGVGKTNSAVALSLHLAHKGEKTGIIDYDGGHSVCNTLGIAKTLQPNVIETVEENLSVIIIENTEYVGILESQERKEPLKEYLAQFPGDYGLIPLADMVNAFFGIPSDVPTLQKFTTLVCALRNFEKENFKNVIIDVEPTAGLERLLSNAQSTARSLANLKKQGILSLAILGAKWPDIAGYLKSDYIKNADQYSANIEWASSIIKNALYLIVSTAEIGPIYQTFKVRKIIEKFGGKIHGYVVNNLRGEAYEAGNILALGEDAKNVVRVKRYSDLHANENRIPVLMNIGHLIAESL